MFSLALSSGLGIRVLLKTQTSAAITGLESKLAEFAAVYRFDGNLTTTNFTPLNGSSRRSNCSIRPNAALGSSRQIGIG
jgi:hypothetical protein